jgi:hypothetical protein
MKHPNIGRKINPTNFNKICRLCNSADCKSGAYLEFRTKPGRQVWICRLCIEKGNSSIVQYNIQEGKLKPLDFVTGDAKHGCPLSCPKKRQDACPAGAETAKVQGKLLELTALLKRLKAR